MTHLNLAPHSAVKLCSSEIQFRWLIVCINAKRMLADRTIAVKTVNQAADALNVNPKMMSRYAKKYGISLNLRGHGVSKLTGVAIPVSQTDDDVSSLWRLTMLKAA